MFLVLKGIYHRKFWRTGRFISVLFMYQVFYDEDETEYAELIELFKFNAVAVSNVSSNNGT
jgi:hypothetical protein